MHQDTKMLHFLGTQHVTRNQCYVSDSLLRPLQNHIEKLFCTATFLAESKDLCTVDCIEIKHMHLSDI